MAGTSGWLNSGPTAVAVCVISLKGATYAAATRCFLGAAGAACFLGAAGAATSPAATATQAIIISLFIVGSFLFVVWGLKTLCFPWWPPVREDAVKNIKPVLSVC